MGLLYLQSYATTVPSLDAAGKLIVFLKKNILCASWLQKKKDFITLDITKREVLLMEIELLCAISTSLRRAYPISLSIDSYLKDNISFIQGAALAA